MALKISDKKIFNILFCSFIIGGFIWMIYVQYKEDKSKRASYKQSSFNGVVIDTVHYELQHNAPTYFFTNGTSHLSGISEQNMQFIAKVGDSLSKESGNDTVYVFRKNNSGNFVQIYPRK